MITKEQYLKAKAIVNQYYKEQPSKTDKQTGSYKPEMIEQKCSICGSKFKGTVKIEICPTCYI